MSTSSKAPARAVAVAIVIAALSGSAYFLFTRVPGDTADEVVETVEKAADVAIDKTRNAKNLAKEIASDIKNGLQINPRITIGKTIFTEGNREITELAAKEKRFTHTYSWSHKWMGSTKVLELKGNFVGKAGYDLTGKWAAPNTLTDLGKKENSFTHTESWNSEWKREAKSFDVKDPITNEPGDNLTGIVATAPPTPWGIEISEDGQVISAILPTPKILSVEMTGYEIVEDEGGYWNKISKEDRQSAVNSLQSGARAELGETQILQEADEAFLRQIEDAARKRAPSGFKVIRPQLP